MDSRDRRGGDASRDGRRCGDARSYFERKRRLGEIEPFTNEILGTGAPGAALGIAFWGIGAWRGNAKAVHAGQAQLEALAVTGIFTAGLKRLSIRERPEGSDRLSFPSGHTSTVFASATVLSMFYGWPVGVPAFALGFATAVGRMADRKHWFSDTVGGAALGIWVGQAFSRPHWRRLSGEGVAAPTSVVVLPVFDGETAGVVARADF